MKIVAKVEPYTLYNDVVIKLSTHHFKHSISTLSQTGTSNTNDDVHAEPRVAFPTVALAVVLR